MLKTKDDLKSLILSFNEATQFWVNSLNESNISANVSNPIEEFKKLVKLVKAHTTKVGIIFKPENLDKDPSTAYNTLEKLSESLVLLVSVISQLSPKDLSQIYYNEIIEQCKALFEFNHQFSSELMVENDGRLIGVGKIWSICDSITQLLDNGKLGYLTYKVNQSLALIDDGFDEFEEWTENPESQEDPFGFSDDEEEPESVDTEALKQFSKKWLKKIQLIRLLIASFKKSLPQKTTGNEIDHIYSIQSGLINLIDQFIVDLMLDMTIDDEIISCTDKMTNESMKLAKLAQKIHDNKKSQWYETWVTKYENSV